MKSEELPYISGNSVSSEQTKAPRPSDDFSRKYSTLAPMQEQARKTPIAFKKVSMNNLFPSGNEGNTTVQIISSPFPANKHNLNGNIENDVNTTLVGSNNISLNKRIVVKRDAPLKQGHGHTAGLAASAMAMNSFAFSPNGTAKKEHFVSTKINIANNQSLGTIANLNTGPILNSTTTQSILQPITLSNSSNQIIQFIQTPQFFANPPNNSSIHQQEHAQTFPIISSLDNSQNQLIQLYGSKLMRGPQQILPKPQTPALQASAEKLVITESKTFHLQQTEKILHPSQYSNFNPPSSDVQNQGASIILPTGNLNNQPIFFNQPALVQQTVPHGVQIVLKHPATTMTGASIVIQHPRIPAQQSVPQHILRIVNSNTTMHISTPPTIVLSAQQNMMQSNFSGVKENSQSPPVTQTSTLQKESKTQTMPASMNNHVFGQSVTQLQNVQLSGNLAHIPIANGLNGSFIPSVQSQFQHSFPGFNQFYQNMNLGQLNNETHQQHQNVSTATLQSSCQQFNAEIEIHSSGTGQNLHFPTNKIQNKTPVLQPSSDSLYSMTSNATDMKNIIIYCKDLPVSQISPCENTFVNDIKIKPKRKLKKKKKKNGVESFLKMKSEVSRTENSIKSNRVKAEKNKESSEPIGQDVNVTGKLDLANVIKLCGILEEDEFFDKDTEQALSLTSSKLKDKIVTSPSSQIVSAAGSGISMDIPSTPLDNLILRPTVQIQKNTNKTTILPNSKYVLRQKTFDLKGTNFLTSQTEIQNNEENLEKTCELSINKNLKKMQSTEVANFSNLEEVMSLSSLSSSKNDNILNLRNNYCIPAIPGTCSAVNAHSIAVANSSYGTKYCEANASQILVSTSPIETEARRPFSKEKDFLFYSSTESKTTGTDKIHAKNLNSISRLPIAANLSNSQARYQDAIINEGTSQHNENVNIIRSTPSVAQTFKNNPINSAQRGQKTSRNMQRTKNCSTVLTSDKTFLKQNLSSKNFPEQGGIKNDAISSTNNSDMVEKFCVFEVPRNKNALQLSIDRNHDMILPGKLTHEKMVEKTNRSSMERNFESGQDDNSQLIFQTFLNGTLLNVTFIENREENVSKNLSPESKKLSDVTTRNIFFPSNSKVILPKPSSNTLLQNKVSKTGTEFRKASLHSRRNVDQVSENHEIDDQVEPKMGTFLSTNLPSLNGNDNICLPKMMPDPELFPLDTVTNRIKHISASHSSSSLKPVEHFLIAPAEVDAQKITQGWSQEQIHFENDGTPDTIEPRNKSVLLWKADHQVGNSNFKKVVHPFHHTQSFKQVANVAPMIDVSRAKRHAKTRKSKPLPQKNGEALANTPSKSQSFSMKMSYKNPIQVVQPNITKGLQRSIKALPTTSSISVSSSSPIPSSVHHYQPQLGTKLVAVTAPIQKNLKSKLINNPHDLEQISADATISQNLQLQNYHVDKSLSSPTKEDTSLVKKVNGTISDVRLGSGIETAETSQFKIAASYRRQHSIEHSIAKDLEMKNFPEQFTEKLQNKKLVSLSVPINFDSKLMNCSSRIPSTMLNEITTNSEICTVLQSLLAEEETILSSDKKNVAEAQATSTHKSLSPSDKEDQNTRTTPLLAVENFSNESDRLELETTCQEVALPTRLQDQEQYDKRQSVVEIDWKAQRQAIENFYDSTDDHIQNGTIKSSCKNFDEGKCGNFNEKQNGNDLVENCSKENNNRKEVSNLTIMKPDFESQISANDENLSSGFAECGRYQERRQVISQHQKQKNTENQGHSLGNSLDRRQQNGTPSEHQNEVCQKQILQHCQQKCKEQRADLDDQEFNGQGNCRMLQRHLVRANQNTNSVQFSVSAAIIRKRCSETTQKIEHSLQSSTDKLKKNMFLNFSEKPCKISPKKKLSLQKLLPQEQCKISGLLHQHQKQNKSAKQKGDLQSNENIIATSSFLQKGDRLMLMTDDEEVTQLGNSGKGINLEFHQSADLQTLQQPKSTISSISWDKSLILNSSDQLAANPTAIEKPNLKLLSYPSSILSDEHAMVSAQIIPEAPIKMSNIPLKFLFERQLRVDQQDCTKTDYFAPFHSKEEAIKRLIRFHCMYQECEEKLSDTVEELEETAIKLRRKYECLSQKFQQLMLHESMHAHDTSEICLINRLFVSDIQSELNNLRAYGCFCDESTTCIQRKTASSSCFSSKSNKEESSDFELHSMCLQRLSGQDNTCIQHNSDGTVQMSLQLYRYEDQNKLRLASNSTSRKNIRDIFESGNVHRENNLSKKSFDFMTPKNISSETLTACTNGGFSPIKAINNCQVLSNNDSKPPLDLFKIDSDHIDSVVNKRKIIFAQVNDFKLKSSNYKMEVMGELSDELSLESPKKSSVRSRRNQFTKSDSANSRDCVLKKSSINVSPWYNHHECPVDICKNSNQSCDVNVILRDEPSTTEFKVQTITDDLEVQLGQETNENSTINAKNEHVGSLLSSEEGFNAKKHKNTHLDISFEAIQEIKPLLNLRSNCKTHLDILDPKYTENNLFQVLDFTNQVSSNEKKNQQLDVSELIVGNSVLNSYFETMQDLQVEETAAMSHRSSCDGCISSQSIPFPSVSTKSALRSYNDGNMKIKTYPRALKRAHKQYLLRADKRHKNDSDEKTTQSISPFPLVSAIACSVELLEPQQHAVPLSNTESSTAKPTTYTQIEKQSCKTKKRDFEVKSSSFEVVPEKKSCIFEKQKGLETSFEKNLNVQNTADIGNLRLLTKVTDHDSKAMVEITKTSPKNQEAIFLRQRYSGGALDCCLRLQSKSIQTDENFGILSPLNEVGTSSLFSEPMSSIPTNLKQERNRLNEKTESGGFSSNFDDDINRHVQHAIDTILHLQNCENNSMDSCMSSNVVSNPFGQSHKDSEDTNSVHKSTSYCNSDEVLPSCKDDFGYNRKINQRNKIFPSQKVIVTPNYGHDNVSHVEVSNVGPTLAAVSNT